MAIEVTADDITSHALKDIPLRVSATAESGNIEKIILKGLPSAASVSAATRNSDNGWEIKFADLDNAKLTFTKRPTEAIQVEVVALGSSAGVPSTASTTFNLTLTTKSSSALAWEKIGTAIALILFNIAIFMCWRILYERAQNVLTADWAVPWDQRSDIWLSSGPITFWYDPAEKKLHHRGPIDTALKSQLLNLVRIVSPVTRGKDSGVGDNKDVLTVENSGSHATQTDDPRAASYLAAIDRLTYVSNGQNDRYFLYLLSIAGLSGVLGTQVRAFANFIYVSTTRNDLDVAVWWPWYALRPALGFLLGLMVVLLVQAKLFVPATESLPSGTAWWMALAMLVGFAADDFAQRLRLVGQALFGKDKR